MGQAADISPGGCALRVVAGDADIDVVARLAHEIWYEHYVPIIGREQVDYMVAKFQSAEAIAAQIAEGYEYFLVRKAGQDVAYGAIRCESEQRTMFLSKLYVLQSQRAGGLGRILLGEFERLARQRGLQSIWLTVNKYNPALDAYRRLGFKVTAPVVTDIGNGFVMDDYRMEKIII